MTISCSAIDRHISPPDPEVGFHRVTESSSHYPFPPDGGDGFVSVDQLLTALPSLALPHFQRGRVWDEADTSRLMESLIDGTPCGSIILWQPADDIRRLGEAPPEWGGSSPTLARYLVVDGQQRLTALWDLFGPDRVWAVNLAAFPQLGLDPPRRVESVDCFVPIPTPPPPTASPATRRNYLNRVERLVPLDDVMRLGTAASTQAANSREWERLAESIRRAVNRRFHVAIRQRTCLPDVVNLYNRINSSGVPVRKEERAFAAMVSSQREAPQWLADCFKAAHPDTDAPSRNAVLKRQRERLFGFPLFIAAYAQTVGYHLNLRGDLDLLARVEPNTTWMSSDPSAGDAMLDDSFRCIATTARVLREVLSCDDLRFLPSAEPLRLAFILLLRYPQIDDNCLVAALLLGQVNGISQTVKPNQLESRISNSRHLPDALGCFPSVVEMLGDEARFTRTLEDAQTMNDSWVSLLYWYQRSRAARD